MSRTICQIAMQISFDLSQAVCQMAIATPEDADMSFISNWG